MKGHANSPEGADNMSSAPWNEVDQKKVTVLISVGLSVNITVKENYEESDLWFAAKNMFPQYEIEWIEEV